MSLVYDSTGTLTDNHIILEVHTPIINPHVGTIEGPFYSDGLEVTGIDINNATLPLVAGQDYLYSPLYASASAATGKEVYSYILLTNYANWNTIKISYHGVGGDPDNILLAQIVQAGNFDRTNIDMWLAFEGDLAALNVSGVQYDLKNTSVIYLLASKLDAIAASLRAPNAYVNFINIEFASAVQQLGSLQILVDSLNASMQNNGNLTGDSVTALAVDDMIAAALAGLNLDTASTKKISDFATAAQGSKADAVKAIVGLIKSGGVNGNFAQALAGTSIADLVALAGKDYIAPAALISHINSNNPHPSGTRIRLANDLKFYVKPTGDDTHDGLTLNTAFKTIQGAWDHIANFYDLAGYAVTIELQAGTYNLGLTAIGLLTGQTDASNVTISGIDGIGSSSINVRPDKWVGNWQFGVGATTVLTVYPDRVDGTGEAWPTPDAGSGIDANSQEHYIRAGDRWLIAGTTPELGAYKGYSIIAKIDNPGQNANNWDVIARERQQGALIAVAGATIWVKNLKLTSTGYSWAALITAILNGLVIVKEGMILGDVNGNHFSAGTYGYIAITAAYKADGYCIYHYDITNYGIVTLDAGINPILGASFGLIPEWLGSSGTFCGCFNHGEFTTSGSIWLNNSGVKYDYASLAGYKYWTNTFGIIFTNSGGEDYFPGNADGIGAFGTPDTRNDANRGLYI